jgi:hypothetical protein
MYRSRWSWAAIVVGALLAVASFGAVLGDLAGRGDVHGLDLGDVIALVFSLLIVIVGIFRPGRPPSAMPRVA